MADPQTGTSDPTYNLVAVVYNALQGAETVTRYQEDAERDGDQDTSDFFREVQESNRKLAERGKTLLGQRLTS
jgi:hypothetical protein